MKTLKFIGLMSICVAGNVAKMWGLHLNTGSI